jgi:hypothetical protein
VKTKNHTEHALLELAIAKAANEDGITPASTRETSSQRKQGWSPLEVWRTRVKPAPHLPRSDQA